MYYFNQMNLENGSTLRDIYPTAMGQSTGAIATGSTSNIASDRSISANPNSSTNPMPMPAGNPVIGRIVFVVLVFGVMLLAKYTGEGEDFKNLKPSVYNVLVISLAAIAGIPLFKWIFVKFQIPGVSTWVMAA